MVPIETLYRRPSRSATCCLDNKGPVIVGEELIEDATRQVKFIKMSIKKAQD